MMTLVVFSLKAVEEEDKMTPEQLAIKNVGKQVKYFLLDCKKNCVSISYCNLKFIGLQKQFYLFFI